MPKQDYIPDRDAEFLAWHNNYKTQVAALKTTFGLADAEVTAVADDNTSAHTKVTAANTAKQASQASTQDKSTVKRGIEARSRTLANKLKAHANYTAALGQQLGIIGPEDTTDLTNAKPTLKVDDSTPGRITVEFTKSISDGVNFYSKRAGETAFSFLARDTDSPYVDTRAPGGNVPETRQYYAVYVLHDETIGLQSDTVQGVCKA